MEHRTIVASEQALAAEGTSTVVVFDYAAGRPHPVPNAVRRAVADLEGKAF